MTSLTLINSTMDGSGIDSFATGPITIINSTIKNNSSSGVDTGELSGGLRIINSTLSGNGYALNLAETSVDLINSTVSGNIKGIGLSDSGLLSVNSTITANSEFGISAGAPLSRFTLINSIVAHNGGGDC